MKDNEKEMAWCVMIVAACMLGLVSVTLGLLVAATETVYPLIALAVRVVFWCALAGALLYAVWVDGRRFEREHGAARCGAREEEKEENKVRRLEDGGRPC